MKKNTIKISRVLFLIFLAVLLIACDTDTKSTSSVTPVSLKHKKSLQGTYEIQKAEVTGSDGSQISTEKFDVFLGYMAIDAENERIFVDALIVEAGKVKLDLSEIRAGFYYDRLKTSGGTVSANGVYLTERINGTAGHETSNYLYLYKKISDNIITKYFDILAPSEAETAKSFIMSEDKLCEFSGYVLFNQVLKK